MRNFTVSDALSGAQHPLERERRRLEGVDDLTTNSTTRKPDSLGSRVAQSSDLLVIPDGFRAYGTPFPSGLRSKLGPDHQTGISAYDRPTMTIPPLAAVLIVTFGLVFSQPQTLKVCNSDAKRDPGLDAVAKAHAAGQDIQALFAQTPYDNISISESNETTLQGHLRTVSCSGVGKVLAYGVFTSTSGTTLVLATGRAQANQPVPPGQPTMPTPALKSAEEAGRRILQLTNQARSKGAQCGSQRFPPAPPLAWNPKLYQAALAHARRMATANFFDHTDPADNSSSWDRMVRAGYAPSASGENIAAGDSSPESTVQGWLKSPGHCSNIMSTDFREFGAAYATNPKSEWGIYWVQVFGSPQ